MNKVKLEANGPPMALGIQIQAQPDGSYLARLTELPGMYFAGNSIEEVAHRASAAVSLLMVAAKLTGTTLEQIWADKEGMIQTQVVAGGLNGGQIAFTGGKGGNA